MNWAIEHANKLAARSTVNAFGIVLFQLRHANVVKALHDSDYWAALDEVSGDRWHIFATVAATENTDHVAYFKLSGVDKSPRENLPLLKDFGLDAQEDLPCLLIFLLDADGETLQIRMGLKEDTVESAYRSLHEAIDVATRAIDRISAENFKNTLGVFAALELATTSYKHAALAKRAIPFAQILTTLLRKVAGA